MIIPGIKINITSVVEKLNHHNRIVATANTKRDTKNK
jgi:hypothetical protein